jgi:ubiquinone/menaquinone biosynthesis C-methylase UbiE
MNMTMSQEFELTPMLPAKLVRRLGKDLLSQCLIADIGTNSGRNAFHLAGLGHTVVGIDVAARSLQVAQFIKQGVTAKAPNFAQANALQLPFKSGVFDIILMNELFQDLYKSERLEALAEAQRITTPEGLHVVSGYLADKKIEDPLSRARAFEHDELPDIYEDMGWKVLSYTETINRPTNHNGRQLVNSLAEMIAQKPLE